MKRPNRFDMLVYWIFYLVWNPIFQKDATLMDFFVAYIVSHRGTLPPHTKKEVK